MSEIKAIAGAVEALAALAKDGLGYAVEIGKNTGSIPKSATEQASEVQAIMARVGDGVELAAVVGELFSLEWPVVDARPAVMHDRAGFLVWDRGLYHEVYFKALDGKFEQSFFSGSKDNAETRFAELVVEYGIHDMPVSSPS